MSSLHRVLNCLSFLHLSFSKTATAHRTRSFSDIDISQGSVVTHLRCGGIFNVSFIADFRQIVTVEEFQKSTSIW